MKETTKEGFEKALLELGEKKDIVLLAGQIDAKFAEKFPQKFIQCSADTIGIATGLALQGKTVFAEAQHLNQMRNACINNADIKIIGNLDDISLLRALPVTIIIPADSAEAQKATIAAAIKKGPAYIQVSKEKTPTITKEFVLGRAEISREGKDCTIVACGKILHEALTAAEKLAKQDIECTIIDNHTIKPIDKHTILSSARITKCIVTAEEHNILGSTVAETISQNYPVPMRIIKGTYKDIIRAVKEAIRQKCENTIEEEGVSSEFQFKVHGGSTIRSIAELQKTLIHMDDTAFAHHVNEQKNDFSIWIRDVFKDETLANQVAKRKTKLSIASLLANRK